MEFSTIFSLIGIIGQAVSILKNPALLAKIYTFIMAGVSLVEAIKNDSPPEVKKASAIKFINEGIYAEEAIFDKLTPEQERFVTEILIPQGIDLIYGLCKFLGIFKSNKVK